MKLLDYFLTMLFSFKINLNLNLFEYGAKLPSPFLFGLVAFRVESNTLHLCWIFNSRTHTRAILKLWGMDERKKHCDSHLNDSIDPLMILCYGHSKFILGNGKIQKYRLGRIMKISTTQSNSYHYCGAPRNH